MPKAWGSKGRGCRQEFGYSPVVLLGALFIQLIAVVSLTSKGAGHPTPNPSRRYSQARRKMLQPINPNSLGTHVKPH